MENCRINKWKKLIENIHNNFKLPVTSFTCDSSPKIDKTVAEPAGICVCPASRIKTDGNFRFLAALCNVCSSASFQSLIICPENGIDSTILYKLSAACPTCTNK
uniref:Uncharacterized protein n=1 Tax=Romanomermis culicivorax TaxID=13658 RepID=A0A915JVF1_ROMCU